MNRKVEQELSSALNAVPLTEATGSEVKSGIKLSSITDDQAASVKRLVSERCALVFRNQFLSPDQLVEFGKQLGALTYTPGLPANTEWENVFLVTSPKKGGYPTEHWHTDATTQERPPAYTVLATREIPNVGGDTLIANQYETYESLSEGFKKLLCGLKLRHEIRIQPEKAGVIFNDSRPRGGATHPLVRVNPETQRRCLYLNAPGGVQDIEGFSTRESQLLINYLYELSFADQRRIFRHRWLPGDVLIFDNRCSLHSVVHDYAADQERSLYRVMTEGETPYNTPCDHGIR